MKSYLAAVTALLMIAVTIVGTFAHGHLTNRWNHADEKLAKAAEAMKSVPTEFGDWRMQSETPFEPRIQQILDYSGAINRVYVDARTNQTISVAIIVGPPGPTSTHTAELCYSSNGFKTIEDTQVARIDVGGKANEFRRTLLESKAIDSRRLEVLYGWRYGDAWEAPSTPRWHYGLRPFLFKIQIAAEYDAPLEPSADEDKQSVAEQFLAAFLPELNKQVFTQVHFE